MVDGGPTQILEYVYIGSKADAKNKSLLQSLGITHILNITPSRTTDPLAGVPNFHEDKHPSSSSERSCFTYQRLSLFDTVGEDLLTSIPAAVAFITLAKFHGKVLVHCNKGISRSSSMVSAYLMSCCDFTLSQALAFVKSRRLIANPNPGFLAQLATYQDQRRTAVTHSTVHSHQPSPPHYTTHRSLTHQKTLKGGNATTMIGPTLPPIKTVVEQPCGGSPHSSSPRSSSSKGNLKSGLSLSLPLSSPATTAALIGPSMRPRPTQTSNPPHSHRSIKSSEGGVTKTDSQVIGSSSSELKPPLNDAAATASSYALTMTKTTFKSCESASHEPKRRKKE